MALTKCKECGNDVSKKADKCPNCGAPIKKRTTVLTWFVLFLFVLMFIGFLGNDSSIATSNTTYAANKPTKSNVYRDLRYAHNTINIRDGVGKSHKVVGQLKRGDSVEVKGVEGEWARISIGDAPKGFVYEPLLKHNPIPPLEIADWNWYSDPEFGVDGSIIWNVEVRNNTNRYVKTVKVEFSSYDSSEKLITSDFTYVKGLSPGGKGTAKSYTTYFGREKTGRIRIVQ